MKLHNTAAFPVEVICPVRLAFVVTVAAFPVIEPTIALVTVISVAQSLVSLAPVAPIVCPAVWSTRTAVVGAVVEVAAFPVIEPAIALVTCKSVNQPFVIRAHVAPISPVS